MTKIELNIAPNAEVVAKQITQQMLQIATSVQNAPCAVGLSGGSTPASLFAYWCQNPTLILESGIHFFWIDERMVPVESNESNFGNALRLCFETIGFPQEQLHPIVYDGASVELSAQRYNEHLLNFMAQYSKRTPLDLAILGIGDDGHTSSLFPGQELHALPTFYIASINPTTRVERVALSYKGIEASSHLFYHVMGAKKKEILQQVIAQASSQTTLLPTQYLPSAYTMCGRKVAIYTDIQL